VEASVAVQPLEAGVSETVFGKPLGVAVEPVPAISTVTLWVAGEI
jgi:hypothetical protein